MRSKRRIGGNSWVYILVGLMLLYNVFITGDEDQKRRPPPGGEDLDIHEGALLPPPRATDPQLVVEALPPRDSQGTAFAVSSDGLWLTARHVVEGCRQIALADTRGFIKHYVKSVKLHPRADVALLETPGPSIPLKMGEPLFRQGQAGFHFGFPAGKPTAVDSRLLGRSIIRSQGYRFGQEPSLSWAEKRRVPERSGALGGLSGGPTLDDEGGYIGIAVAASHRRGRVESAPPRSLAYVLKGLEGRLSGVGFTLSSATVGQTEEDLRKRGSVMRVFCRVSR